jgi:symplekin
MRNFYGKTSLTVSREPTNPLNPRIAQYLDRVHRMRLDIFDESTRKRPAPAEPSDGLENAKRARLVPDNNKAQGPISLAQLFTLTDQPQLKGFDATAIPQNTLLLILAPLLRAIDDAQFNAAIQEVSRRYLVIEAQHKQALAAKVAAPPPAVTAMEAQPSPSPPEDMDEDDDEYEPDFVATSTAAINVSEPSIQPNGEAVASYRPPEVEAPASEEKCRAAAIAAAEQLYSVITSIGETKGKHLQKAGFARLAASNHDREAWITVLIRVATRPMAGLDTSKPSTNDSSGEKVWKPVRPGHSIQDRIRDRLFKYIIEDFRKRLDAAITWLMEEWYAERVELSTHSQNAQNGTNSFELRQNPLYKGLTTNPTGPYAIWSMNVLEAMLPYLEVTDKNILIRFLSEIPEIYGEVVDKVKHLARDPERVVLVVNSLQ